jgi:cell division control protein 45
MVFIPPPHLASASRPSYAEAYNNILAAHRRSPLSAASSVIILVAPDVDALCAAKMFAELFKQDDVMHRIIPLSGIADLERMRDELITYSEVHHVSPIIRLGPDGAPSASHTYSLKYRLYPRLAFIGVVW